MFPARSNRSHGYSDQKDFGRGMGYQQHGPYLQDTVSGFGVASRGMNAPQQSMLRPDRSFGMSQFGARLSDPVHQDQQFRGYGSNRGKQKRPYDDDDRSYYPKRSRQDQYVPRREQYSRKDTYPPSLLSTIPSPQFVPSEVKNDYIVPISEGTQKITMAIWKYFLAAKMEDEDLKKKLELRKSLMSVVNGAFPDCRIFIVGSSMTGFATKTSDVDMCLMVSVDEIDQKRDATLILSSIMKALRTCSHVQHLQVIRAKVPILKFLDKIAGVECDLNINNLVGVRNTHLMRLYAYMDWRVRPLMLFIKKWARFHDINDASKQTVSSYTLTLMLIHYLQVGISPPILPCLQTMKPELFDLRKDVRKLSLRFSEELDFVSQNPATLGELFLGFLNYYANEFSFSTQVISVRLGRALSFREVDSNNALQWKHLNVEEPFERSNTARSVYDKFVFMRVLRVFQASYNTLEKCRDTDQIFVRPF